MASKRSESQPRAASQPSLPEGRKLFCFVMLAMVGNLHRSLSFCEVDEMGLEADERLVREYPISGDVRYRLDRVGPYEVHGLMGMAACTGGQLADRQCLWYFVRFALSFFLCHVGLRFLLILLPCIVHKSTKT